MAVGALGEGSAILSPAAGVAERSRRMNVVIRRRRVVATSATVEETA
jgi:hypothetical protein